MLGRRACESRLTMVLSSCINSFSRMVIRSATTDGNGSASTGSSLPTARPISREEIWARREKLGQPSTQRSERPLAPKIYYAPEWKIDQSEEDEDFDPLANMLSRTTPNKWEYYNKIVWPPGHIVPETGLPKPREVFHCRESIHFSPKRMWYACQMVRRMNLKEAIKQLKFKDIKATLILSEVLEEAKERAKKEFRIEDTDNMFVAEAFPIQEKILKSKKRHARERWTQTRHRYINLFVRIEEGEGPKYKGRHHSPDGWERMKNYYQYLREREPKYSL